MCCVSFKRIQRFHFTVCYVSLMLHLYYVLFVLHVFILHFFSCYLLVYYNIFCLTLNTDFNNTESYKSFKSKPLMVFSYSLRDETLSGFFVVNHNWFSEGVL